MAKYKVARRKYSLRRSDQVTISPCGCAQLGPWELLAIDIVKFVVELLIEYLLRWSEELSVYNQSYWRQVSHDTPVVFTIGLSGSGFGMSPGNSCVSTEAGNSCLSGEPGASYTGTS